MTVRIEDNTTHLIVHNASENRGAISPELYQRIIEAVDTANASRIRCIILTGGSFFYAGGNLNVLKTRAALPLKERREKVELLHDTIRAMNRSQVPLIAAVEGGGSRSGPVPDAGLRYDRRGGRREIYRRLCKGRPHPGWRADPRPKPFASTSNGDGDVPFRAGLLS